MAKTAREYVESVRAHLWQVPHESDPNVCRLCLGAVSGTYEQCYNCYELLRRSGAPPSLLRRVVPMSIARNPGAWYSMLQTYKSGAFREHAPVVASLAYSWLTAHGRELDALLGGEVDFLTIVPSKRFGVTFESQSLRAALALVPAIARQLVSTLRCENSETYRRARYSPEIFRVDRDRVEGKRILLIEDMWITGATAVSAAGALLNAGAESVVVTPIARDFRVQFHAEDQPYLSRIVKPYDVHFWPRS